MTTRGSKTKSVPTDADPIYITKDEVDAIVQRAVAAAVATMSQDITTKVNSKIDNMQSKYQSVSDDYQQLSDKYDSLASELQIWKDKAVSQAQLIQDQGKEIDMLRKDFRKCMLWCNRNEQYSRRSSVRITGLKLQEGESAMTAASKLIRTDLGVDLPEGSIVAAHPLPRRNKASEKPPSLIVRFAKRETRDEVISRRKQLKNTGRVITEDITVLNQLLLNRLYNHEALDSCWTWRGKIYGCTSDGTKIRFEPYDDINAKITEAKTVRKNGGSDADTGDVDSDGHEDNH